MNKKLVAIVFAALFIGVAPATAINMGGEITADPLAVRGRGADASQILEENINSTTVENNTESAITSDTENTTNDDPAPAGDQITADTQVPDYVPNLNETIPENITVPQKDTTGIVMQSRNYTCGPAALATVLQNMGFNVTEHELKVLAGTDETGTSMHGLAQAARSKGLSAAGMKLSTDELRPNNIVHVILDGTPHYSVIKEVTNESVRLADPSLGNIELTREKFNEIYTGNALVITNPNMEAPDANSSIETSANNITDASVQSQNSQTLTAETMQTISGKVIWKAVIIAKIVAIKIKAIKIGKAAWNMGIRGRKLINRIRRAILNRVPFAGHRRVRNAARGAAILVTDYMLDAIPRNKFCWWAAADHLKRGAIVGFLWP